MAKYKKGDCVRLRRTLINVVVTDVFDDGCNSKYALIGSDYSEYQMFESDIKPTIKDSMWNFAAWITTGEVTKMKLITISTISFLAGALLIFLIS